MCLYRLNRLRQGETSSADLGGPPVFYASDSFKHVLALDVCAAFALVSFDVGARE